MFEAIAHGKSSLLENRWWIYQKERFPIFKYGFLIAIFSGSAVSYPKLLGVETSSFGIAWAVAFIVIFCLFFQMRIADEFKDYEDDCRYRPERAIPRGLVSRQELGYVGLFTGIIQFITTYLFNPPLLLFLGLVWGYFALMCAEFGVRNWLKANLSLYMISHMMILPLMALFCLVCSGSFKTIYLLFCLTCFFNGIVIEIGRKIRAPQDERVGVETYSSIWQPKNAALVWLISIFLTTVTAIWTATQIGFGWQLSIALCVCLSPTISISWWFIKKLDRKSAKWIDRMSGIWTIVLYFSLGLLPLWLSS
ncbi:UbiA prenyltransferase [[Leptolyngbya] sp. PCC 7376]|uniref:UbiA family prenyltransferase n=1 Tax=[Leptolyngbya] sp. PCC 7376 TaxID=111781 RepID=UPI00029F3C42|nr:UbiA family prenyltransferase [[Leptolyngbya] sp. PCC 7376]AFY38428.1 UbiA prenyltransferase [[Leptolyngbya] sp. PCC 7376]